MTRFLLSLVLVFVLVVPARGQDGKIEQDRAVLKTLWNKANGANWKKDSNWLSDKPLKEWYGVKTNAHGRVVELKLNNNNLIGAIPSEIGELSELEKLDMSKNQLSVDTSLSAFTRSFMGITPIPDALGRLTNLKELKLDNNKLTEEIPTTLGNLKNLEKLELSNNQLSGSIPVELGNLTKLKKVSFNNNNLCMPASLKNWKFYKKSPPCK